MALCPLAWLCSCRLNGKTQPLVKGLTAQVLHSGFRVGIFLGTSRPRTFCPDLGAAKRQQLEWIGADQLSQPSQMHGDWLVVSPSFPEDTPFLFRVCSAIQLRKEAGLPGPGESLSKPVKSTKHLAVEPAYSWPSRPSASFDLRIRPHHECPYCHVMCTQCVNYWK